MLQPLLEIRFRKLDPRAVAPEYHTEGSAGFDLSLLEDVTVPAGTTVMARTGLVIAAPRNHMLLITPRSSTWKKYGLDLGNTVGIVDEDYCGDEDELFLALRNPARPISQLRYGSKEWHDSARMLSAGTRLAQGIFLPVTRGAFTEVDEMGESRGGWGSTG